MKALLLALVVTSSLDATTTCIGLSRGMVETNPLFGARPSCARVVATKAVSVGGTVFLSRWLTKRYPTAVRWGLGIAVGAHAVSVTWNLRQLSK